MSGAKLSRLLKLPVNTSLLESVFFFLFMLRQTAKMILGKKNFKQIFFLM